MSAIPVEPQHEDERRRGWPTVPDYQLLRQIGRGAYGDVWLCRSLATGVQRAVKIVRRSSFADERPYQREFEGIRKFEGISRSHPSQLALFHVGRDDMEGCFYYVMELADGLTKAEIRNGEPGTANQHGPNSTPIGDSFCPGYTPHTLRHELDRGRLPAARVLELGLVLVEAVFHLHQHGLVHRDIKPSNIIFVNGRPKLADIGLVTEASDERSLVGTEGYLAPEGPGTPQADIFALGKVLYEALTGQHRREFPALPNELRQWPDAELAFELNAVLVTACAFDPRQRYQSVEAMRADLERLKSGRSVKGRRFWRQALGRSIRGLLVVGLVALSSFLAYRGGMRESAPEIRFLSKFDSANRAYDRGLRALHTASDQAGDQAVEYFKEAIRIDPAFGEAYAQLAAAYLTTGGLNHSLLAAEAAKKAKQFAPNLAKTHTMLAGAALFVDLDWSRAEEERSTAIGLDPQSAEIAYESALLLSGMHQTNQALKEIRRATDLDPRSIMDLRHAGHVYTWLRQFDQAIECYNEVRKRVPTSTEWMDRALAVAYRGKRDYLTSIQLEREAARLRKEPPEQVNARFQALEEEFRKDGEPGYWRQQLRIAQNDEHDPMWLAAIYAHLGKPDLAFHYLARARKLTPFDFANAIETDSSFDSLRTDPRFGKMIRELWERK